MNKQLKKCFLFFVSTLAAMENQSLPIKAPDDIWRLIVFQAVPFEDSPVLHVATIMNQQLQLEQNTEEIPKNNIITSICNERLGRISSPLFLVNKQLYRVLKQCLTMHRSSILNQYPDFNNYSLPEMLKQVHSKFILNNHSLFEKQIKIGTEKEGCSVAILLDFYKNGEYSAIKISENLNVKAPGKLIHHLVTEIQTRSNQFEYHLERNENEKKEEKNYYVLRDKKKKPTFAICESWLLFLVECERLSLGAKNKDLNPLSLWIDETFFNVQSRIQKWYNDFRTNI